jgi:AcrR family transcriptional regulator
VREVAKGAAVSLAMVHHYFGSKEGLYQACIQAMLDELAGLGRELAQSLAGGDTGPAAIAERAVRVGWRFARQNKDAVRLLQRSIVEAGEVDADIRATRMLPFLDTVAGGLAVLTGRTPAALRLAIQSAVFLVVRYAISSERELAELAFGVGGTRRGGDAEAAVEDHLVDSTLMLLALHRSDSSRAAARN